MLNVYIHLYLEYFHKLINEINEIVSILKYQLTLIITLKYYKVIQGISELE